MLVDLFYQLFMKKCERKILTEIKKTPHEKRLSDCDVGSCHRVVMLHAADTECHICLYQTSGSHLNLTLVKAPS